MSAWDVLLRFERAHRAHAPVDFRRWKKASQAALRTLFPGDDVRVLDATAGLGDHTVNLAELGFQVSAGDASEVAREATLAACIAAGLEVPVLDVQWETLGTSHPAQFDLIFHDAIHWIEHEAVMHEVLQSLRAALRPEGALVFFFADFRDVTPGAGDRVRLWDIQNLARHELAYREPYEGGHVTKTVVRVPVNDVVEEHHLFVIEAPDAEPRLESATLTRIYRWDFAAMQEIVLRAGFSRLEGHLFVNDKGHETAMCLAYV